jgi:hypothetical protein
MRGFTRKKSTSPDTRSRFAAIRQDMHHRAEIVGGGDFLRLGWRGHTVPILLKPKNRLGNPRHSLAVHDRAKGGGHRGAATGIVP